MMDQMIQTQRVLLRNFRETDIPTLFEYRNDSRCNRYQRYADTSQEYLWDFVQKYSDSCFPSMEEEQHYAVSGRSTSDMIGDLSVFFSEKDRCFTLGITIAPAFQRQGYACELLREVVRQLQERYPAYDIVALIDGENAGSIALFRKLGFVEECYAESIRSWVYVIYGRK